MKCVFFFFIVVGCLYISCSKSTSSPTPTPPPPSTTLQADRQNISLSGRVNAIDSITINSNSNWNISFSPLIPSWLSISDTAGKGNKKVFLTIKEANNTGSNRLVRMNITPATGGSNLSVTITQQTNNELLIHSVNPTQGPANTLVTISGTGFDLNSSMDSVFFNGKAATIISVTATSIVAKVPLGAGTGNVSVKVNNTLVTGTVFNYELSLVRTLIAGSGFAGIADGIGAAASFGMPTGLTIDNSGNIYVADLGAYTIRKITPQGVVTTLAGTALKQGNTDGLGTQALFHSVNDIAVDASGNLFVVDFGNSNIRKIEPNGLVTTFAIDMVLPSGITIDNSGFLYIVSPFLNQVRKIASDGSWVEVGDNLYNPFDIAVDASGNLYIADSQGQTINRMSPTGVITQIAGVFGSKGFTNGEGSIATFNTPKSIAIDKAGNLFVADVGNNAIRKITPSGTVSTYIEKTASYSTNADYFGSFGVAVDKNDVVYFTNSENRVFKIEMK
jgi:sugar lactone lactonase YvrE